MLVRRKPPYALRLSTVDGLVCGGSNRLEICAFIGTEGRPLLGLNRGDGIEVLCPAIRQAVDAPIALVRVISRFYVTFCAEPIHEGLDEGKVVGAGLERTHRTLSA